jgi:signal transduction histidine kinase
MVNLINDFLNVSRIQTGKFIIDKHPTNLSKLVEQEIDRLRSSALSRDMEFIYEPPIDFPMIDVDESKIREVVMNF